MAAAPVGVGYVWHELYAWHDSGLESYTPFVQPHGSNESAESKRRMHNLITVSGLADSLLAVKPRVATDEEVLRIHTERYLAQVKEISSQKIGGQVGHEMHIGPGGFHVAALSAGAVLQATEDVVAGNYRRAYALNRPPGHHAEADQGHGFCCFSNIAIAAAHAIAKLGIKRVAVVDWDVHHGNGTEAQFYDRDDLLFISLHQDRLYPLNTGDVGDVGTGAGKGYNLNIPLPPGSGYGAYKQAFETVVLPALRAYRPEIIFVSSGFDGSFLDTLGRMMLTSESYRSMTKMLCDLADEMPECKGRVVMAHEGGYSEIYVPFCGLATIEEMCGVRTKVQDPFIHDVGSDAWQECMPHQAAAIERAAQNLKIALLP